MGEDSVTFFLDSPDEEEGFPGNLHAEVSYTLRDGTLDIDYRALCDRDTVVNPVSYTHLRAHETSV